MTDRESGTDKESRTAKESGTDREGNSNGGCVIQKIKREREREEMGSYNKYISVLVRTKGSA